MSPFYQSVLVRHMHVADFSLSVWALSLHLTMIVMALRFCTSSGLAWSIPSAKSVRFRCPFQDSSESRVMLLTESIPLAYKLSLRTGLILRTMESHSISQPWSAILQVRFYSRPTNGCKWIADCQECNFSTLLERCRCNSMKTPVSTPSLTEHSEKQYGF